MGGHGQVVIRRAVIDDLPVLLALETNAFPVAGYRAEDFAAALGDEDLIAFVAEESEVVVGFLICHERCGELHLIDSVVAPIQRGKGIGVALIRRALEVSGARIARAETRETNLVARAALEALGFHVERKMKDYYDFPVEDALLLVLEEEQRDY